MNLKTFILGSMLTVVSFAFIACGGDSSSDPGTSSPVNSSSSYSDPVVIPEPTEGSPIVWLTKFGDTRTADSIVFKGNVSIDYSLATSDSVYIDSIKFTLATADPNHYALNDAAFNVNPFDYTMRNMVNIAIDLHPALSLKSFDACGDFVAFVAVYSGEFVSVDSLSFSKAQADYCPDEIESSSSSVAAQITMTSWTTTLSTNATGYLAVDLDSKTNFFQSELAANKDAIDLVVSFENKTLSLMNTKEAGYLYSALAGASAFAKIGEETTGAFDANNLPPALVYTSVFGYNASSMGALVEEPSYGEFWIVTTPSYDATTMKGFFVVMTGATTVSGSDVSIPLTIWGVE